MECFTVREMAASSQSSRTDSDPRVLFLHGGPGFSAALGRRRYGASLPIHWWDQPHIAAGAANPFGTLVSAAIGELHRLSDRRGAPVAVLVSSLGTYLAWELLRQAPDRIASVVVSGGTFDARTPFARWGRRLARSHDDPAMDKATRLAESGDPEAFWALIDRIVAIPRFYDEYWGPDSREQRAAMRALAAEGPMFDLATFQAVMPALLSAGKLPTLADPACPTRVLVGRHDPLAEETDPEIWRAIVPFASMELVDCGHFPHLELPPAMWMP